MSTKESVVEKAKESMGLELLQALLDEIRTLDKPWPAMTSEKQAETIDRLRRRVRYLINDAVDHIAARGTQRMVVTVEGVTFKDGGKVVATFPSTIGRQDRHALSEAEGQGVVLCFIKRDDLTAFMSNVKPDPDQASLELKEARQNPPANPPRTAADDADDVINRVKRGLDGANKPDDDGAPQDK